MLLSEKHADGQRRGTYRGTSRPALVLPGYLVRSVGIDRGHARAIGRKRSASVAIPERLVRVPGTGCRPIGTRGRRFRYEITDEIAANEMVSDVCSQNDFRRSRQCVARRCDVRRPTNF